MKTKTKAATDKAISILPIVEDYQTVLNLARTVDPHTLRRHRDVLIAQLQRSLGCLSAFLDDPETLRGYFADTASDEALIEDLHHLHGLLEEIVTVVQASDGE